MPSLLLGEEYLKPEELADGLKVSVRTVYEWNAAGTGPRFTRVGKHVRYARCDVQDWLSARSEGGRPA